MAARMPATPAPTTTTSCRTIHASVSRPNQRTAGYQATLACRARGSTQLARRLARESGAGTWGILGGRGTGAAPRTFPEGHLAKMAFALPAARRVDGNLSQTDLHERTFSMSNARRTDYGAPNVQTRVLARSKASTFIVSDTPDDEPHLAIDREEWERVSALQDAF